MQVEIHHRKL